MRNPMGCSRFSGKSVPDRYSTGEAIAMEVFKRSLNPCRSTAVQFAHPADTADPLQHDLSVPIAVTHSTQM